MSTDTYSCGHTYDYHGPASLALCAEDRSFEIPCPKCHGKPPPTERTIVDLIKSRSLAWMKDQGYKKKQIDAAAWAVYDVISEIGVLERQKDDYNEQSLYISFGNYTELYGICHNFDSENRVWDTSIFITGDPDDVHIKRRGRP